MATAQTTEPSVAAPTKPQVTALEQAPWDIDPPAAPKAASRRPSRRPARRAGPEAIHWSVVALTIATAASIVFGAHGVERTRPGEALPLVIAIGAG
jgi:hypothetical protein